MSKFHISPDGEPRACRARSTSCPLGDQPHFSSKAEARAAYEAQQSTFSAPRAYLNRDVSRDDETNRLGHAIREVLSDPDFVKRNNLLKSEYLDATLPLTGHCYVASEVLYHLMGGKAAGWVPEGMKYGDGQHWWLRSPSGEKVDLTAEQFSTPVPYEEGKGRGFLTREPSARAQKVIDELRARRLA